MALVPTTSKSKKSKKEEKIEFKIQPYKPLFVTSEGRFPKARSGHRIVCNDDNLYVFGGYNPNQDRNQIRLACPMVTDLWKYNFMSQKWQQLPFKNFPKEVASPAMILLGKTLIIFGGTGYPFGTNCSNRMLACNLEPVDGVYKFDEIKTTGQIPAGLYGHCMVRHYNYLYSVGGTSGYDYHVNVYRLDLITKVWEAVHIRSTSYEEPCPRYRHEIALYDDSIYVFGGGENDIVYGFEKVPVFDLKLLKWKLRRTVGDLRYKSGEQYPCARKYLSLVQSPKDAAMVFITGGLDGDGIALLDSWRINLKKMEWTRMDELDLSRGTYFHSSTITTSGKMIHFGGVETRGRRTTPYRTRHMYETWIGIPSLQDMCWEIVGQCYRANYIRKENVGGLLSCFRDRIPE